MAEKDILADLSFGQKINFITWGMRRRLKYFDYLADGMAQKPAYKRAKELKKVEL